VQHGCVGLERHPGVDERRQRLVVDLDELGGVLCLEQRFGDDKGAGRNNRKGNERNSITLVFC
jgi:hypothetical protein